MPTEPVLRPMREADIPAGLALCRAAGWNQLEADWRRILQQGDATVAEQDGIVIGSVAVLHYPQWDWVAMLLVSPDARGRGVGTLLLSHALSASGRVVGLDATPEGRRVYLKHGFVDDFEIRRLEGITPGGATGELPPMRSGYLAQHIGPVIAPDDETAWTMLRSVPSGQRVFLDVPVVHTDWLDSLRGIGFEERRRLIRMWRPAPPDEAEIPHAIEGPEFG
ncbi:MAG: GNAT family N-acetyltransferase [Acidobacteria bacterium]|nr:GNAT family N-acetyltransferase [Acidobacteriota bacterium]